MRWVALCCANPAERMGLRGKGRIAVGSDADIVLFDPSFRLRISRAGDAPTLHEAADWTPYEGIEVEGWPRTVLLRGCAIIRNHEYIGSAGNGRFIERIGRG